MVSSGLYYDGSGKPATLSTTTRLVLPHAKKQYKSRANAQRPTPDRCERSSYSQVAGFRPRKIYQTFRSRNKSTTLIQYVNKNIVFPNQKKYSLKQREYLKQEITGMTTTRPLISSCFLRKCPWSIRCARKLTLSEKAVRRIHLQVNLY